VGEAGHFGVRVGISSLTAISNAEKRLGFCAKNPLVRQRSNFFICRDMIKDVIEKPATADHPQTPEARFKALAARWKAERGATSSATQMAMHPAYQSLIGLGADAIPLLLRELQCEPDHWFWALCAITGEDPVPPEARGNVQEMAKAWLEWGRQQGTK
jgi:hypothetical protein